MPRNTTCCGHASQGDTPFLAFLEVRQFDKMAWLCGGDSQGGDSHAVLLAKGNGFRGVGAER